MRIAVTILVSLFVAELLFVGAIDLTLRTPVAPASMPEPNQQTQFYLWDSRYDVNDANRADPNQVDPNQDHGKDKP